MGTRAVYSFKSHGESFHVYKHWDNSPEWAYNNLDAALGYAWSLPRFEADEFAAAFIAANKNNEGDVRLIKSPRQSADAAYFYEISFDHLINQLIVVVKDDLRKQLFKGTLDQFKTFARQTQDA